MKNCSGCGEISSVTVQNGMDSILRLNPVFKEMIWGGDRLKKEFGYDIPGDDTGECWAISAHPHGDCTVNGGKFDGKTLSWLWENEPQLFGRQAGQSFGNQDDSGFPLLVKIIDARKDLSIQVHPDDEYARVNENGARGKTECWYILDCDPGATIIIGHNAKTREELVEMIENNRWSELIREIPIRKGDFFQIFPGTVHAIKGGTMILETQQNSDVTYRLYDYGRLQNGKLRELHLKQSIDVIRVPFDADAGYDKGEPLKGGKNESLVACGCYRVWRLACNGHEEYCTDPEQFMLASVIGGEGTITPETGKNDRPEAGGADGSDLPIPASCATEKIKKGDHFIMPTGIRGFSLDGDVELICSVCYSK